MNTFANLEPKVAKLFRLVQYYKALELQGPDQDFTANVEPQIVSLMTLIQNYKAVDTDDAEQQCRAVDKYEALNRYNKELDEGNWISIQTKMAQAYLWRNGRTTYIGKGVAWGVGRSGIQSEERVIGTKLCFPRI